MSTPTNREILLEAWSTIDGRRDETAVDRYFHPDFVRHSEDSDYTRDEYRALLRALHSAFPDLDGTLSEIVAEGDLVAYRWSSTGTHEGEYLGVPPTHKRVVATGLTISRFRDGQIVEEWASWNKVSVLHRLGIIPISPR